MRYTETVRFCKICGKHIGSVISSGRTDIMSTGLTTESCTDHPGQTSEIILSEFLKKLANIQELVFTEAFELLSDPMVIGNLMEDQEEKNFTRLEFVELHNQWTEKIIEMFKEHLFNE